MHPFLYLNTMPTIALVRTIQSRSAVEIIHAICPCWHTNVGFEIHSVKFYINPRKEREAIFCFRITTLSFTFFRVIWKSHLYASGFLAVLWLLQFSLSLWDQSIPNTLSPCLQRHWLLSSAHPKWSNFLSLRLFIFFSWQWWRDEFSWVSKDDCKYYLNTACEKPSKNLEVTGHL